MNPPTGSVIGPADSMHASALALDNQYTLFLQSLCKHHSFAVPFLLSPVQEHARMQTLRICIQLLLTGPAKLRFDVQSRVSHLTGILCKAEEIFH